jgi:hypothetical protein
MYKSATKYVLSFAILILFSSLFTRSVYAACTALPSVGSVSLINCVQSVSTVTGADGAGNLELSTTNNAALTLNAGASITINTGGTLTFGSVIFNGGSISIDQAAPAGIMLPGAPMYAVDADADGYVPSVPPTIYTATASGRRRLGLMRSASVADCGDAYFSTINQCCSSNGVACGADANCCSAVCGTNADSDNFFSLAAGHTGTCQAAAKPYTDCYDSNALAYPGSTTCLGTNRGDGSFDYNCSSTQTTCGTIYTNTCSGATTNNNICSGTTCTLSGVTTYAASAAGCGTIGCTCSGSTSLNTACTQVGGAYPSCTPNTPVSFCTSVASGTQFCQ